MFKDEGANAVLHIESITYECTGTVPIPILMLLNFILQCMHAYGQERLGLVMTLVTNL